MGTLTQAPPPIEHTGRDPLPLSSGATPIFKFGLPLIIVCALAGLIWSAFAEGLVAILFALFGCGAAILFVSQFLVPLKAVSAVQDGLVITITGAQFMFRRRQFGRSIEQSGVGISWRSSFTSQRRLGARSCSWRAPALSGGLSIPSSLSYRAGQVSLHRISRGCLTRRSSGRASRAAERQVVRRP
jgi:hypothetical protein